MNMLAALPELALLGMIAATLLLTLYSPERCKNTLAYGLAQATIIVTLIALLFVTSAGRLLPLISFNGMFILDQLALVLKIFILIGTFAIFLFTRSYLTRQGIVPTEYYLLSLFVLLGMLLLVSANTLLVLYLALELLSLPLYALIATKRDSAMCSEAAMKYFVLGALASGFILYGMSMIYGATGHLDLASITLNALANANSHSMLVFGMVFVLVGIVFKFGAVPFHVWVPDVFHGAPSSVTMFIASVPKIAVLGLAFRILLIALPNLNTTWLPCLMLMALYSIALGNIVAIQQKNIKRLLAYSSIAHMGYLFLGFLAGPRGEAAAIFYIIAYAIMTIGAFAMLVLLSREGIECEYISDLKGLNRRNPWLAFLMLIFMFSMAGIPPTIGFFAKFALLQALVNVHLTGLAIIALVFSVIGAYYYINVVRAMYFEEPTETAQIIMLADQRIWISMTGIAVVLLGVFPGALMGLCQSVFGIF